jgi:hypothetical protein
MVGSSNDLIGPEDWHFPSSLLFREGAIFGVGLAISSLCKEAEISAISIRVQSVHSEMVEYFERVIHDQDIQKIQVTTFTNFINDLCTFMVVILQLLQTPTAVVYRRILEAAAPSLASCADVVSGRGSPNVCSHSPHIWLPGN